MTGLSRAQVTRLLHQHRTTGAIADRRRPRHPFPRRYTKADIGLLAEVDALHGTLSGPATRKLCVRALQLFGDRRFERLAAISNGHLYNLRHSTSYQRVPTRFVRKYTVRGSSGRRSSPPTSPPAGRPRCGNSSESPTSSSTTRALYRCASLATARPAVVGAPRPRGASRVRSEILRR